MTSNLASPDLEKLKLLFDVVALQWQPIESAKKDGTRILGWGRMAFDAHKAIAVIRWSGSRSSWECDPNEATEYAPEACDVTHWMPLPLPPESSA